MLLTRPARKNTAPAARVDLGYVAWRHLGGQRTLSPRSHACDGIHSAWGDPWALRFRVFLCGRMGFLFLRTRSSLELPHSRSSTSLGGVGHVSGCARTVGRLSPHRGALRPSCFPLAALGLAEGEGSSAGGLGGKTLLQTRSGRPESLDCLCRRRRQCSDRDVRRKVSSWSQFTAFSVRLLVRARVVKPQGWALPPDRPGVGGSIPEEHGRLAHTTRWRHNTVDRRPAWWSGHTHGANTACTASIASA